MPLTRGTGSRLAVQTTTIGGETVDILAYVPVDSTGALQDGTLTAGIDRSGATSATIGTATTLAPANAVRRGLEIQNVSAGNIGINEIGGAASIGTAGTYTIAAGGTFKVRTNRAISVVGSAASQAYTATEY